MLTRRKILFTLSVIGVLIGACWLGERTWANHQQAIVLAQLGQARTLRGQARYAEAEERYHAAFLLAWGVLPPKHRKTLCIQLEWMNILFAENRDHDAREMMAGGGRRSIILHAPSDVPHEQPSQLNQLLTRLHFQKPIDQPYIYGVCLDAVHPQFVPEPLDPEGHEALEELFIRAGRGGLYPTNESYLRALATELQRQGRSAEAMTAARQLSEVQ